MNSAGWPGPTELLISALQTLHPVHSRAKRNMAMEADFYVFAKLGEEGFDG